MELWMLMGLLLGTALALAAWLRAQDHTARNRAAATQVDCDQLLELISLLQEHRGMSSALLGGDITFAEAMRQRRERIESALNELSLAAKLETRMPRPCLTHNDLLLFRHRWNDLVDKLPALNVEQNIALHSQMIGRALDWLAALGEARIERPARGSVPAALVRNYTNHLPALAECLGQIRAIGSGAAAQGSCSPVARVRLMFLVTRATVLLGQAGNKDEVAAAQLAARHIDALIATVRRELLSPIVVGIGTEPYFEIATLAITAVYDWIHHCGCAIGERIHQAGTEATPTRIAGI